MIFLEVKTILCYSFILNKNNPGFLRSISQDLWRMIKKANNHQFV